MSSSAPPLLSAAGAGQPSRSASCAVAKPTRGFHVFRIDGYSWTKALPGAERISSEVFTIGGHNWYVDYYPNGTDGGKDESDSISLYLRMLTRTGSKQRVRAEYKFSLLDLAGNAAYELPSETGVFTARAADSMGCGYAGFITKVELERRRDRLLREDCLAIRCDVGVTEVVGMLVEANRHGHGRLRSRSRSPSLSDDDLPLPCRRGGFRFG
jgi:speckle-type POZ protein